MLKLVFSQRKLYLGGCLLVIFLEALMLGGGRVPRSISALKYLIISGEINTSISEPDACIKFSHASPQ